ncbi:hypothetical protein GCM10028895_12120 [Pontibacter rugosus]
MHAGFDPQVIISAEETDLIVNHFGLDANQRETFRAGIEMLASDEAPGDGFIQLCHALQKKHKGKALEEQLLSNLLWASEIVVKTANLSAQEFRASDSNPRDSAMARNFLFWDRYFHHRKTIVLGASTHLAYGFSLLDSGELAAFSPMGEVLGNNFHASEIINVAFSCRNGEWRGINDIASSTFPEAANTVEAGHTQYPAIINTDTLTNHASTVLGNRAAGDWSKTFDYILVFENASPVRQKAVAAKEEVFEEHSQAVCLLRDEHTGHVIDFAHVYFPARGEGTTSNEAGEFVIKNTRQYSGSEMIISRIGYQTKSLVFSTAGEDTVTIQLTPQANVLAEVVVKESCPLP